MPAIPAEPDRQAVRQEMKQARQAFHHLVDHATVADLRRPSDGIRWTNEQLLFHMLFGYLITRTLLVLARTFGQLPDRASAEFVRLLDAARTPFEHGQLRGILPRRADHPCLPHGSQVRPGDRRAPEPVAPARFPP